MSSSIFQRSVTTPAMWYRRQHSVKRLMARTIAGTSHTRLKESSAHDPGYQRHKEDSLDKQKQGKGHWKSELASDSEETVKADRAGPRDGERSGESMSALQERTKHTANDKS